MVLEVLLMVYAGLMDNWSVLCDLCNTEENLFQIWEMFCVMLPQFPMKY